ncbi:MAG TPA: hypothetical protein VEW46_16405, partial [Pyrinomonadaceae bacterium]|nr:hypothetical protein [Pyrinomonadaceae bacterium]
ATRTVGGVVSTRRSNGQGWQWREARPISPIGSWKIQLRNTSEVMKWFKEGQIEDLALLVTFGGTTRAWPV